MCINNIHSSDTWETPVLVWNTCNDDNFHSSLLLGDIEGGEEDAKEIIIILIIVVIGCLHICYGDLRNQRTAHIDRNVEAPPHLI